MVTKTIYPDKDAEIRAAQATTNFGSTEYLTVAQMNATNGQRRALLEFDLSGLPDVPIAFINSCTLNVHDSGATDPRTIDFRKIETDSWTESGVTWSNQPSSTDHNVEDDWTSGWNSRSMLALLRSALRDADSFLGILMKYTDESYDGSLDANVLRSKESSYDPYLYIQYSKYTRCILHSAVRCEALGTVMDGWGHITLTDWDAGFTTGEFTFKTEWGATYTGVLLDEGETVTYTSGAKHHSFKCENVYDNGPCDNLTDASVTECFWQDDAYVKTDGDNDKSGLSWTEAWETITHAANEAADGQEVHIGFGTYDSETDVTPDNAGSTGIKYTPETAGSGGGTGSVTINM